MSISINAENSRFAFEEGMELARQIAVRKAKKSAAFVRSYQDQRRTPFIEMALMRERAVLAAMSDLATAIRSAKYRRRKK